MRRKKERSKQGVHVPAKLYPHIHAHTYTRTHTHTRTRTHTHVHTHTHTRTHAHMHTVTMTPTDCTIWTCLNTSSTTRWLSTARSHSCWHTSRRAQLYSTHSVERVYCSLVNRDLISILSLCAAGVRRWVCSGTMLLRPGST